MGNFAEGDGVRVDGSFLALTAQSVSSWLPSASHLWKQTKSQHHMVNVARRYIVSEILGNSPVERIMEKALCQRSRRFEEWSHGAFDLRIIWMTEAVAVL